MLEIAAAALAQSAVGFLLGKVVDGALQEAGGDTYKAAMQKLKGFFNYKFGDKQELANAELNPDSLIKLVEQEIKNDKRLQEELSQLITKLQQITGEQSPTISQGHKSTAVLNSSVTDSDFSDNSIDASNFQASHVSGGVNIGNRGDSFRSQ